MFLAVAFAVPLSGQILGGRREPPAAGSATDRTTHLPDGRSRDLVMLKNDVEKSGADMAKVIELATELQQEIERNQFHTVDLRSVRKAEEIIKLVRRVKSRLSRAR